MGIFTSKQLEFTRKKVGLTNYTKWACIMLLLAFFFTYQTYAQCTAEVSSVTDGTVNPPGGVVTLSASGTGNLHWYDALTEGKRVNIGNTYSPNVSATTNFYVESVVLTGTSSAVPLAPTGTFTGNTRGYWFTSPADIMITSVYVPTDASTANQSIAVVRFNGAKEPPVFSATTNDFTTLFLTQNNPASGPIPVEIVIRAGDVIGFLGSRNNVNSYSNTVAPINIAGNSVILRRMGMQFVLRDTAPRNLWQETTNNASISRVVFDYSPVCFSTPRTQVTATVQCVSTTPSVSITANPSGTITPGTSVKFTASPTNGGSVPTYVWKKNNTVIPNETAATFTTNTLANGDKIEVEMTSSDACASPATATSNEITVVVTSACDVTPPTINAPTQKIVCFPNTLILTANGCEGTVTWSNGSSGTSLTLSNVGTYSLSANCSVNGCTSDESTSVTGLEIKAKPNAPTVNAPTEKVVCFPTTLTLTATGCNGTVTWSNAATGTSLTLSNVGTYSLSANCSVNGCTSDESTSVNGLEIKAKPNAPTVNAPTQKVVCFPSTLTLTATGCEGIVTWSNTATGTSLTLSNVGTYSLSANCTVNGCTSDESTNITGLEIKAKPNAPTINTPAEKVVCSPSTLTLTATGCSGTVTWSNAATGTSLTLSNVGTYSLSANCKINSCTSDASSSVTGLEIKAKPNAPTVNAPTEKVVCSPSTLTLTATGCAGTVTWSNAATGTSLTLSNVGTYSLSANCSVNNCTSDESTSVTGLEIKAKPNAPTVNAPTQKVVCFPSTLTLTATGCAGTVTWSNAATGTSLTLSNVGTYSLSANCTVNGCTSDESTSITGLEIKAKPNAPTVNAPTEKVVCFPSTLTLTATGCNGTVTWSNGSSGTSLTLSNVGTYSLSANCTVNGCTSDESTSVTGLEIKALPNAQASNTGPYLVEQNIDLMASGGMKYIWTGPNNFSSSSQNPTINNAILAMAGTYTVTVTGFNACVSTATTEVTISGVDPCDPSRIVDYIYVKAANPYQALFPLKNGMVINQRNEHVSVLAKIVCPQAKIKSFEMNIQGPELNWNIIQNVDPYTLFDNFKLDVFGRNFIPGNYSLTVTGFPDVNKSGPMSYGPKIIQFTVVGNLAVINAPVISKNSICAGSNIDVNIATNGSFVGGDNTFQVQLSDSSGSFAAPIVIGSANTTGSVACTIPLNTVQGSRYLIRVSSSNQIVASNPAMSFVTVHPFKHNVNQAISDNQTKKAVGTINADNKIISPAKVNFEAGKAIEFKPGFSVDAGTVFKADIKACEN